MIKKLLVFLFIFGIFAGFPRIVSANTQYQIIPVVADISYPSTYTNQRGSYVARSNDDGSVIAILGALPHPVSGEFGYLDGAFVIDRTAGTTEFVGYKPDGSSFMSSDFHTYPDAISADGRYVLFAAFSDRAGTLAGVYLFDRQTHTTQTIADNSADTHYLFSCNSTMDSTANIFVYCMSPANNTNLALDKIYIFNRSTGSIVQLPSAHPREVAISSNGEYIAYTDLADNSLNIYDAQLGTVTQVNTPEGIAFEPSISDVKSITYDTYDTVSPFTPHVTYHDLVSGQVIEEPIGTHTALLSADGSTLVMHRASGDIQYSNPPESAGITIPGGQYADPYSINSTGTIFTMNNGDWNTDSLVFVTQAANTPPIVSQLTGGTINEGTNYSTTGSFTDADSTSWTGTVDYGDGSGTQNLSLNADNSFSLSHVYQDNGTYTVTVSITDNQGAIGSSSATVTVNNVAPTIGVIGASINPVQINNATVLSANFTDPGVLDTHTASWNWGDGNSSTGTVTESNGSGLVSDSHIYTTAGVYQVTLTVTDKDGGSNTQTFQYISAYNPTAQGLFSAGSVYTSPVGSLVQNPSATGRVMFGLSYKYQGTVPTGNRQFSMDFNTANFHFNATTVSSLVIANGMGTLTGTGTINGNGTYNFLVTGSESANTIRIKITNQSGNVVYDTQMGDPNTASPTAIVTGNVLAH